MTVFYEQWTELFLSNAEPPRVKQVGVWCGVWCCRDGSVGGGDGGCDPSVRRRRGSGDRLQPTSTVAPQKPKTRRPIIIMEMDSLYISSRFDW